VGLEDIAQIEEFISILSQKVDLVLLTFKNFLFLRVILVLLADDAHSAANIILLFIALLAGELVDEGLLDDLAGLELLGVEDLAGFGHHWEVFGEDGMTTDV
jgi:hypothetical protein